MTRPNEFARCIKKRQHKPPSAFWPVRITPRKMLHPILLRDISGFGHALQQLLWRGRRPRPFFSAASLYCHRVAQPEGGLPGRLGSTAHRSLGPQGGGRGMRLRLAYGAFC